jgi:site-specific recombinase XerD
MRANEVTKLTIDDIDWEKGEMTLHCKGRHKKRFPVMNDVGKALVDYLKHARPKTECRNVFVVIRAPRNAFKSGVGAIVTRAMLRAGIKSYKKGSHILRHTVASQMLRQGATLPEVGEVLHHRSLKTTAIYAKVDYGRLREISRPWPTGNGGAK